MGDLRGIRKICINYHLAFFWVENETKISHVLPEELERHKRTGK